MCRKVYLIPQEGHFFHVLYLSDTFKLCQPNLYNWLLDWIFMSSKLCPVHSTTPCQQQIKLTKQTLTLFPVSFHDTLGSREAIFLSFMLSFQCNHYLLHSQGMNHSPCWKSPFFFSSRLFLMDCLESGYASLETIIFFFFMWRTPEISFSVWIQTCCECKGKHW